MAPAREKAGRSADCNPVVCGLRRVRSGRSSGPPNRGPDRPLGHWWTAPDKAPLARAGLDLDTAKAAAIFEGLRRRSDVRGAVAINTLPDDWQTITGLVFAWVNQDWLTLTEPQRARFLNEVFSPCYLPPVGLALAPKRPDLQARLACAVLPLPANDNCDAAVQFTRSCRQLAKAGYTLVAVDTKSHEAIRHAAEMLAQLPQTWRTADVQAQRVARVTRQGVTAAGTFTLVGHAIVAGRWRTTYHFSWTRVTRELEAFDKDGTASDWMSRLRL